MSTTSEQSLLNIPKRLTGGRAPSISPEVRNAIVERYLDGWSYRQNAKASGVSVASIVRIVSQARKDGVVS